MHELEKNREEREILGGKIADKSKTESTLRNTMIAQLRNSDELKSFKNVNPQVSTIYERLADADEKIRLLERNVYGFKAAALGITNPDIRTIPLKKSEYFPSNTIGTKGPTFVGYTIVGVDENTVRVRVYVRNAYNNVFKGDVYTLPLTPGTVQRVISPIVGMADSLLTVLERPTGDTAVIAIGTIDGCH